MAGEPIRSSRQPLTLAVAQPLCLARNVAANAMAHAALIREARARVVVFPELSLTGYELDAPPLEPADDRLAPLLDACRDTDSVALVGAPVRGVGGAVHIAMLAVDRDGASVAYRKMWLGGAEPARFSPGTQPVMLEVDGWRLGLAICKDTGVPSHAAATAALGIDVYAAGVLEAEADAARRDDRGRRIAIRHRVWVAVASFAGSTGGGFDLAAGGSAIWDPQGRCVARAGSAPGEFARIQIGGRRRTAGVEIR